VKKPEEIMIKGEKDQNEEKILEKKKLEICNFLK
jgi:hypothetical protein